MFDVTADEVIHLDSLIGWPKSITPAGDQDWHGNANPTPADRDRR